MTLRIPAAFIASATCGALLVAQTAGQPDWKAVEEETMRHYQSLLRFDTHREGTPGRRVPEEGARQGRHSGADPRARARPPERPRAAERQRQEAAAARSWATATPSPSTRRSGSSRRSARRATAATSTAAARSTTRTTATAALMTMLLLKRLQRCRSIATSSSSSESGEEGNSSVGIGYMVKQHFPEIDAEYCLAEGGGVTRIGGEVKYATVQTLEKIPRGIELVSHGISGHGSIPLKSNAIVHLAGAVAKVGEWRPDIRLQRDDRHLFPRLASISPPDVAKYYRDVLSTDPEGARRGRRLAARKRAVAFVDAADVGVAEHLPGRLSLERDSVGSEGDARRPRAARRGRRRSSSSRSSASSTIRRSTCASPRRNVRPAGHDAHGSTPRRTRRSRRQSRASTTRSTLPTMSTGATDMAQLRAQGRAVLRHRPRRRHGGRARRASARTAIRSACSKASCIASCASTGRSSSSLARSEVTLRHSRARGVPR